MAYAPMELKQRAFDLYENGHSCSRIAQLLTEEHQKLTGRPLTKNSIIGWRDRSLNCQPVVTSKVDLHVFMEQLQAYKKHLEETTKEEYRIRKCLRCRKESVFPKNTFLCDPCKNLDVFRYVA